MQINDCSHFSPAIVPCDCASWANSTSGYISIHWKSDRWCQVCHPLWPNDDIPNRRIQIEANSSRNVKVFGPLGRFTIKFHPILPLSSSILPSFSVFTRKGLAPPVSGETSKYARSRFLSAIEALSFGGEELFAQGRVCKILLSKPTCYSNHLRSDPNKSNSHE